MDRLCEIMKNGPLGEYEIPATNSPDGLGLPEWAFTKFENDLNVYKAQVRDYADQINRYKSHVDLAVAMSATRTLQAKKRDSLDVLECGKGSEPLWSEPLWDKVVLDQLMHNSIINTLIDTMKKSEKEKNMDIIGMNIQIKKPISGRNILKDGPCENEYHEFVKTYGWNIELQEADLIQMKQEHPNWFSWLVCHNYIIEKFRNIIEPGDIFSVDGYGYDLHDIPKEYLWVIFKSESANSWKGILVSLTDGNRFREPVEISSSRITLEEFLEVNKHGNDVWTNHGNIKGRKLIDRGYGQATLTDSPRPVYNINELTGAIRGPYGR